MDYLDISFQLNDEDIALRDAAYKFAREVIRPVAKELDQMTADEVIADGSPLWDLLRQAYELGYHKILIPEAYGGLELSPLQLHLVFEELGWGSFGLAVLLGVVSFPFYMACLTLDDDLIEEFVMPFCECNDGSIRGCWACMEPDRGSDYLCPEDYYTDPNLKLNVHAHLDGDEWVINGQKAAWVSGGSIATHAMLYCQVDPSQGIAGSGIFLCPLNIKGVSRGKPLRKLGQRDLNQGEIFFDDVRIPKHYMICEPDFYSEMMDMILAAANATMGVLSTGCARAAFEEAFTYAKERVQGGKPIIEHRGIRQRLFDMFSKVETCRALSRAVINFNFNISPPLEEYSLISKTRCTELCFEVAHDAIQILGGNGLTQEYLTEKLFRDARATLIEDGINEVLQARGGQIIAETYPRRGDEF